MSKFFCDWRSAIVAFPAMAVYSGLVPLLKLCNVVKISWLWALCPVWIPFVAFWVTTGFIACLALVTEIGFLIVPDEDLMALELK